MRPRVNIDELFRAVDRRRYMRDMTWAQVSTMTGLVAPTFTRMARGQAISVDTYIILCEWLGHEMPYTKESDDGHT
jgi:hypothetical protein